jgi:hypothetical protein
MTVTHALVARNAATDAVTAQIGTGAHLKFHITGSTVAAPSAVAATLTMTSNANGGFGASSGGTATAAAITSDTAAAGNASAVAFASIQTSANAAIIHCAVAASASDINMTNGLTISAGDTVACSSLTYTALPA